MTLRSLHKIAVALMFSLIVVAGTVSADDTTQGKDKTPPRGHITVTQSEIINAAPDELWSSVRDFDALSFWHPQVEGSVIVSGNNNQVGATRRLTLADGSHIDEKLIAYDAKAMRYSYAIVGGALPVTHYRATVAVEPYGKESARLVWKGNFDAAKGENADAARRVIAKFYRAGLDNTRTMLSGDD